MSTESFLVAPSELPDSHQLNEEQSDLHEQGGENAAPCITEIIITCSPGILAGMVAAYETAMERATGDMPMQVLSWGTSCKYGHGIIVLEWVGKVPEAFLHDLTIDAEMFDYYLYEDLRVLLENQEPAEESRPLDPQNNPNQ